MKIALEMNKKVYTVEEEHDEQNLDDMLAILESLLLSAGYRFNGYLDFITEEEAIVIDEDNSKL